jgi:hypothetical protein
LMVSTTSIFPLSLRLGTISYLFEVWIASWNEESSGVEVSRSHVALTNTGFGESAAYAASQVRVTHRIRTRRFISAPFSSQLPGDGVIERRGALSISQSQIRQ